MARGATTVRVRDPPPAARRGATPEGAGSAGASLPGVSGAGQPRAGGRAQATQTSEGAVRPGGKPRHHSNPLLTSAVPSKAECLSDLRLFQLVRDGTYDEVLRELETAAPRDAEAAWIRTKLLRLVQRHRQRTYGSIRNAVTSKRKELTPDVNASTAQNLDTQLPALERPSGEAVAQRLMRDLAVLHDLQPAPLTEGQARPTHEQIYVREAVYVEAELSRSRASSPQGLSRATSPLVDELSLSQSLSGELSANSLVSNAPSTPLAELSASSKSEHGRGGRLGALSTPPFVNRHSWDPRHALPGNDASQRDRRMNSPVGDNPSRGDWSRLSYSPLPARKKHGVWGTAWRHPSDLFKTKPGIDCSGIKTLNSKEFGRVSALIDDLHGRLRWSSTNSLSFSAPRSAWPAAPPKMGSVRLARESAQKEAELFAEEHRALRLEQTEQDIAEVDSHANNFSETIDKAVFEEIQNAQELWENASDAMPPLDSSTLSQARMDEAMQLVLKIENAQKKKEQELKAAIQEIWKSDLVAAALQREEATSHSIYATIFAIDQHAASLAAGRLEVARKRVEKEEAALQRYEQEMSVHDQRFLDEQQSSAASAAGLAEAQSKRDAIALEVGKRQEQVDKYNHDLAHFKSQISKFEADAYSASRQGNPKVVESFKARADEVRERSLSLRATLDDALEELSDMNLKFESLEADFIQWENIVHKDQLRLEETEKVCARDRERKQELEEKVMAEKQDEKEMAKLFEERSAVAQAAKQKAKEQHDAELQSSVTVIDRLRASSLALVAKILLSSQDLELNVEEQEPVYIGERLDGKRHGFGILQYPAGAEYVGQFQDDLPCGIGIERYADGTSFEGNFLNGKRHGLGVYTLPSAVAYLGVFQDDSRGGPGVICIRGGSASMPYWPTIVCVCRPDSHQAASVSKYRTDCAQHSLLLTDVMLVQRTASDMAKRARSLGLTNFFAKEQDAQISSRENMGLSVIPKAPSIKAFVKSDSCLETQTVVAVKMRDADAVARMAATPGGRKAAQRARGHSRLPFEMGEGRRHAKTIYSTSPALSAAYKL